MAYKTAHDVCRAKGVRLFEWPILENVALIGLWKAAIAFKPTGNMTNFAMFAKQRIRWQINHELRHIFNGRHKIRSKTKTVAYIDAYASRRPPVSLVERMEDLNLIDRREEDVVRGLIQGLSQEAIGAQLGVHQTYVSRIILRIRRRSAS